MGAATQITGLFDIPLCPFVSSPTESGVTSAHVSCFCIAQTQAHHPGCFPIGDIDDNIETMLESSLHIIEKGCQPLARSGQVRSVRPGMRVEGFLRGLDVKHVEWCLSDHLDCRSADFLNAAMGLRVLFSKVFNLKCGEVNDSDEDSASQESNEPEPSAPKSSLQSETHGWQKAWNEWVRNQRPACSREPARECLAVYLSGLKDPASCGTQLRADKAWQPRCAVHLFLRSATAKNEASALWPEGIVKLQVNVLDSQSVMQVYEAELDLFTTWFEVAMAQASSRRSARTYKSFRRRMRLEREDKAQVSVTHSAAIAD